MILKVRDFNKFVGLALVSNYDLLSSCHHLVVEDFQSFAKDDRGLSHFLVKTIQDNFQVHNHAKEASGVLHIAHFPMSGFSFPLSFYMP